MNSLFLVKGSKKEEKQKLYNFFYSLLPTLAFKTQ